jgi:predicted transcriptional regulator
MSDAPVRVPEAEMDVLAILRRKGPMLAADLVRALARSRPMTHGSAGTLLARLEAKGLVTRRKGETGKAFLFTATPRAESALRRSIERLVARVFGGDRLSMVASLLESGPLDPAEIARLERLVADHATVNSKRRAKGSRT